MAIPIREIFFLMILNVLVHSGHGKEHVKCERTYKKVGCLKVGKTLGRDLLINDRDVSSDKHGGYILNWKQFAQSIHSLACRCSKKAKDEGYAMFAIRFFAECYGIKNEINMATASMSNECIGPNFKQCIHGHETECVGKAQSEYVFKTVAAIPTEEPSVDGGYSGWSDWGACTEKCGNRGEQSRERICNKPPPSGKKGKDCSHLGPSTELRACNRKPCQKPRLPHYPSEFRWSHAGAIAGMTCIAIKEPADPHTWADNFLCWKKAANIAHPGIRWTHAGVIPGMRCTPVIEPAEPVGHTWKDNYICVPAESPYHFRWQHWNPADMKKCIRFVEPADPNTWADNYLCNEEPRLPHYPSEFKWSYGGAVAGMTCIHVNEPADPHTWADNHLCWKKASYILNPGIRWTHAGVIPGMRCTPIIEPAEPAGHTWKDNYICVPAESPYHFRWQHWHTAEKNCIRFHEPADPHTWADNYLCNEKPRLPHYPSEFKWSYGGAVAGMTCIHINEPADPHTWADNHLCWKKASYILNTGIRWTHAGVISGMRCTPVIEPAEPASHTWKDNYICVPATSPYHFRWQHWNPADMKKCVRFVEPADPNTWADNYLCIA